MPVGAVMDSAVGTEVVAGLDGREPSIVIGRVEITGAGNVAFSLGGLVDDDKWEKTEHLTLSPGEWARMRDLIDAGLND